MKEKAKNLVQQMTLEEKASLCSGLDFWNTKGMERLGVKNAMVTDGPHGLRKQADESDHLGINNSVPATCFPTASATACSFDRGLMQEIGIALSEECLSENVSVLLGPGANIKRSPLCGRNFEYISEDPYVTGEMAAALIEGIQSNDVGTSIKHFAANNQEKSRMVSDSLIDERALREIYLAGFETAVKKEQPWTIMCSYNRINGTYASENQRLLTDILRDEWGFQGLVVTDWGAVVDRVAGITAGLDLEMPSSGGANDRKLVQAVQEGIISEKAVDLCVERITELLLKAENARKKKKEYNPSAHKALAKRAAAESSVLLKNENEILPVDSTQSIAVIGSFAKTPRFQGAGSSKINPTHIESAWDSLLQRGVLAEFSPGYLPEEKEVNNTLIQEACDTAKRNDLVFIFAGLPDDYESEGFDRNNLFLPESHNQLIEAICNVNSNVIVIMQCGAPVIMPWENKVKAILLSYLGGQAGGSACIDLLYGDANPSGKLAETFPLCIEDTPAYLHFAKDEKRVEYRESIFVGYRWYDTAHRNVAYPFGYGLSYTQFTYTDLSLSSTQFTKCAGLTASITVTNTGKYDGAEIIQLYVAKQDSDIMRAKKELKGFAKVFLKVGESKTLRFILEERSFSYYNVVSENWAIEGGNYDILFGHSSRDIALSATITVDGDAQEKLLAYLKESASIYFQLPQVGILDINTASFESLYGAPLSRENTKTTFSRNSTIGDIKETPAGQQILTMIQQTIEQMGGGGAQKMFEAMIMDMPLRTLVMMSGGIVTDEQVNQIIEQLNLCA